MQPITMQELARIHQRDLLKEAEQWRLVRQARAGRPSLSAYLLEWLGGLLIKAGEGLHQRHTPQSTGTLRWAKK
jgi:hypothetical protein